MPLQIADGFVDRAAHLLGRDFGPRGIGAAGAEQHRRNHHGSDDAHFRQTSRSVLGTTNSIVSVDGKVTTGGLRQLPAGGLRR
ncbi:MAG: hypothetical protein QM775_19450 [Pirellulales bacterium]